jgi:hypothetical protein
MVWWIPKVGGKYQSKQWICDLEQDPVNPEKYENLNLQELHMTIITPLQRQRAKGIRIIDALNLKREQVDFQIWDDSEWELVVEATKEYYVKKGRANLDKTCLQVSVFQGNNGTGLENQLCMGSLISPTIFNTKSRSVGSLNLLEGLVSTQKACTRVERTVYLPSQFRLPSSVKEVYPRFVTGIPGEDMYTVDARVIQPKEIKIFANQIFVFNTPFQDDLAIQAIYDTGRSIYLEIFRTTDNHSSDRKIMFQYSTHYQLGANLMEIEDSCPFCSDHPDRLEQSSTIFLAGFHAMGHAGPGKRRRTAATATTSVRI